jgi:hypothetical protein
VFALEPETGKTVWTFRAQGAVSRRRSPDDVHLQRASNASEIAGLRRDTTDGSLQLSGWRAALRAVRVSRDQKHKLCSRHDQLVFLISTDPLRRSETGARQPSTNHPRRLSPFALSALELFDKSLAFYEAAAARVFVPSCLRASVLKSRPVPSATRRTTPITEFAHPITASDAEIWI